jgi:TonB family protein
MDQSGRLLRRAGLFFMLAGLLWFLQSVAGRVHVPRAFQGVASAPKPTLDDAKREIPKVLEQVYSALNDGRPRDVAPFVSQNIANDVHTLDKLCQPFTYRAHYLVSVIERPDATFVAREQILFKPFREKARFLFFQESSGRFFLVAVRDDNFEQELEDAKEAVRQFIFAARAGEWGVVSRYASPHLPIDTLKEPEWTNYLAGMTKAEVDYSEVIADRGIMLRLSVSVRGAGVWAPAFLVEPATGKIVKAFYIVPMGIMTATSGAPSRDGITDPEIENEALKRFGLLDDRHEGQPTADRDEVVQPTVLLKVEPELSDQARQAHFNGDVRVSLFVDEQGNAADIAVIDSPGLGLDEKIIEAVKQWKFKPASKNGTPAANKATITVTFHQY